MENPRLALPAPRPSPRQHNTQTYVPEGREHLLERALPVADRHFLHTITEHRRTLEFVSITHEDYVLIQKIQNITTKAIDITEEKKQSAPRTRTAEWFHYISGEQRKYDTLLTPRRVSSPALPVRRRRVHGASRLGKRPQPTNLTLIGRG